MALVFLQDWCYSVLDSCPRFVLFFFFFFKQKTAYEMRISDWSSDVCSSDLDADSSDRGRNPLPAARAWLGAVHPRRDADHRDLHAGHQGSRADDRRAQWPVVSEFHAPL